MLLVVETGNGDIIERMWRLIVSARRNDDLPLMWRLTEEILATVHAFYRLGRDETIGETFERADSDCVGSDRASLFERVPRFLDIPVDPTTTMPHLLCRPDVVYHL